MTRGTQSGAKRGVRLPRPRTAFWEGTERKFSRSLQNFVLGGTGKAEGRRAAGRRKDPERVPESAENTYLGEDIYE